MVTTRYHLLQKLRHEVLRICTHIHHMHNVHVTYILRINSDDLLKQHLSTDFVVETAVFRMVDIEWWRFNPAELLTVYDVYVDAGGFCDSGDTGVVAGIWRSCLRDVKSWGQLVSPLDIDMNSRLWLSGGCLFRENYGLLDDGCPSVPEYCS